MSLINEALKKAQRNRSGDPAGTMPPMPGGGRVSKRSQPRTSQQLILIAAGAVALVVLSVVVTAYLFNRAPDPKPVAVAPKPLTPAPTPTSPATGPVAPTPLVTIPIVAPKPVADAPATPAAEPPATAPSSVPVETKPTAPAPRPPVVDAPAVATAPATTPPATSATTPGPSATPAPAPAATGPARPDERVNAFIDAIKVAGIRSSGSESRVLMNDRVFRVNDIVERNFGLRLTAVESNALTFTDANGAVYIKNF